MTRLIVLVVLVSSSACDCGSSELPPLPDASFGDVRFDSTVRDGAVFGCDEVTGAGCPCPGEGEERACSTGGVGACGMGRQLCEAGFEFPLWGGCTGVSTSTDETCNGLDDDCDGTNDEALGDTTCGTGACETTTPFCVSGVEQSCVPGMSLDESCDGLDNDCDVMVDEALGDETCGTGACARTTATCVGGVVQTCTPGTAGAETCNGADDDCDASTDEGLGNIVCGVGECRRSVAACRMGVPRTCTPLAPSPELCDGLDNDCNGIVDDGFGTTMCGVGECRRVVVNCSGGGGGTCTPGAPSPEACNGLDDDCDTRTDESLGNLSCGTGACARTVAACAGGVPGMCRPGTPSSEICNGDDDDCDTRTDEGLGSVSCGIGECRRTVASCVGGMPRMCVPGTPTAEVCGDTLDNNCNGTADEMCGCDPTVDADFDTYNECVDCNDTNGGVYPTRPEICNGIDEDCDMLIDETFDGDGDGYSTCSTDPLLRDCNDGNAAIHPGATELCGPTGMGNGVDENCNGFIDETCAPCTTTDVDGDGVTECMGDCNDMNPMISPLRPEVCDGVDNDCNVFTIQNCGVSETCNYASGADVCEDDLLCGCVVTGRTCTGNYICTSFCEASFTGALGSGCTATQSCPYRITLTDNLHGCAESTDPLGTLIGGAMCSADSQCRSGTCDRLCIGPGCTQRYCIDYCSHHMPGANGSCAAGTVCELVRLGGTTPQMYAQCRLDDNGTGGAGAACGGATGTTCRWGTSSCVSGICAPPCARDAQCGSGTHCALLGASQTVGTWGGTAPVYVSGMTAIETVPVCLTDTGAGLHDRQAGAACTRNGDCESQFCDRSLRVCVALCTSDASCPTGLGCEPQYVRTPAGVTFARVCVTAPVSALLEAI